MKLPPTGRLLNAKAPSQVAELLVRGKVLKLRLNGYIEKAQAKLYTPRFLVPKVIENEIVLDVLEVFTYYYLPDSCASVTNKGENWN